MNKDLRKLLEAAKEQGFTWNLSKKGHPMVYLNEELITTFSGTPSDGRSFLNALAPLKRAGFKWPPRR
jgi:hypothetical protein